MNLIEQLGGYENAKKFADGECADGFDVQGLRDALLEYRRKHNIFEEGDKIVFVDDFMHKEIMAVAWVRDGEVWMDGGAKRCTDLSMIRHTTNEEIKANRRI